ncbi:golgin subfamily B member 1-like, partial [Sphaerodactylus townsendi]|uniref:golgin subfamily B member 1-like n=1 Tax=Sphaerodactylus townsendi TaxID=933632 RepID=UPI002026E6C3
VLLEKFQMSEAELESLREISASERQRSQTFVEKLEMELAERKLACHHLEEEVQQLSQALTQARAAEDSRKEESEASEKRHLEELEEKDQQIAELQGAEKDLRSSYDALLAENNQLQQGLDRLMERSAEQASAQQGELPEGARELDRPQAQPEIFAVGTLELDSTLDKPLTGQDNGPPLKEESQPEDNRLKVVVDKLEAENESLHAKVASLEKQLELATSTAESSQ